MKSHARAVVIGGGVVGVSTLYHLAKKGWTDSVLIERKELTSGSTWHAAGLLPLFNMSYSVGQIHKYSVRLYRELEAETGMNPGFSNVTNIRLARTKDRWDEFLYYAGVAETIGVPLNVLTPAQVKEIWPLCETDGVLGAIQHPEDGYIQPADLTQALAKGARDRGASIHRNTAVRAIERQASGEWLVRTDAGDILAEHVISATGNFARRTGAMVGLNVPVIPVEHQYIVTEPHPAIQERRRQGLPEMGVLRESDSSWYMREENGGKQMKSAIWRFLPPGKAERKRLSVPSKGQDAQHHPFRPHGHGRHLSGNDRTAETPPRPAFAAAADAVGGASAGQIPHSFRKGRRALAVVFATGDERCAAARRPW